MAPLADRGTARSHEALNNQAIAERFSDPASYPVGRGFERHYGIIWGVVNFFDPFSLVNDAEPIREVPEDYYITDAVEDHAEQFLDEWDEGEQPFFLYVAHTAPHWPLHARPEDVVRYEKTYEAGWDAVREARHRRMIEMGLIPAGSTLSPPHEPGKDWQDNRTKAWDARAMAVHAAMIDRMDQNIGRLVKKLEQMKVLDDTLILFLSDNGASPEAYPNPGFDRPSQTRDGRKITYPPDKAVMPGSETTFFGIGEKWANVANTPLRRWKAEMHEGGVCTPLIAHWPAGLKAGAGSITSATGHVMDVMATCLQIAGVAYPTEFQGCTVTPIAGRSLVPVFNGDATTRHEVIGWEHFGARALRQGNWKLVARKDEAWKLYDLSKDRTELNDLAAAQPDRVEAMAALWQQWAERTNVFPRPD